MVAAAGLANTPCMSSVSAGLTRIVLRLHSMSSFRSFFLLLLITAFCAASACAADKVEWTGWISDAKCGAKMTGYCAKACIAAGEKPVFVTEEKKVVPIANPERTRNLEGERVAVKGTVENGVLTI